MIKSSKAVFYIQLHIHIKAEMIKSDGMHIKYNNYYMSQVIFIHKIKKTHKTSSMQTASER